MTRENERLTEDRADKKKWRRWGPFLSERQWGNVREDDSDHGNSRASFPHDHSRRRAYRWGEGSGWGDGRVEFVWIRRQLPFCLCGFASSLSDLKKFKKWHQYAAVNGPPYTGCCGRCDGSPENRQTDV